MNRMKPKPPELMAVFERAGSLSNVAAHLGISRAAVSVWRKIPLRHVRAIAAFTGLPPEKLRPDIYGGWGQAA